ncbi:hypothetical protein H4R27_005513, partial [Coemansia aciculifera]
MVGQPMRPNTTLPGLSLFRSNAGSNTAQNQSSTGGFIWGTGPSAAQGHNSTSGPNFATRSNATPLGSTGGFNLAAIPSWPSLSNQTPRYDPADDFIYGT